MTSKVYNVQGPFQAVSDCVVAFKESVNTIVKLDASSGKRSINIRIQDERETAFVQYCKNNDLRYCLLTIDLTKIHTKTLMRYFAWLRADVSAHYDGEPEPTLSGGWFGAPYGVKLDPPITLQMLKDVLDTREHVPNAAEAKKIRQQKAHAKRNRGR